MSDTHTHTGICEEPWTYQAHRERDAKKKRNMVKIAFFQKMKKKEN